MPSDFAERVLVDPLRRLLSWRAGKDGRVILFAVIAVYFCTIAAARFIWGVDLWPWLGVPPGPSLFFDARNLTAAWECQRLGYDPLYENPCDPWRPAADVSSPLASPGHSSGSISRTPSCLSVVLIGAMFLSFAALVATGAGRNRHRAGARRVLAGLMLAIERANMDIALFSVVAVAILLWRAFPGAARVVSPTLVLLAATAKMYPVFALPAFVMTRNRVAARCALAVSGRVRASTWSTVFATSRTSPRSPYRETIFPMARAFCPRTCTIRWGPITGPARARSSSCIALVPLGCHGRHARRSGPSPPGVSREDDDGCGRVARRLACWRAHLSRHVRGRPTTSTIGWCFCC